MYLFFYRNPVLAKSMEKVFWVFPKPGDEVDRWNRLDKNVKEQVRWLLNPKSEGAGGP